MAKETPLCASVVCGVLGDLLLVSAEEAVVATVWPWPIGRNVVAYVISRWPDNPISLPQALHREATAQLRAYFNGSLRRFELPLALAGNDLQVRCWEEACEIPYGKTLTYGALAFEAGYPLAARAAGRAMALCDFPVLVPCQRVVGAGGGPHGNREDWERREALLRFERDQIDQIKESAGVHRGDGPERHAESALRDSAPARPGRTRAAGPPAHGRSAGGHRLQ